VVADNIHLVLDMQVVVGKNQNEEAYDDDDDQKEKLREVGDKIHLVLDMQAVRNLDHIQIAEVVDKSCLVLECLVAHVYYDVN
jgi:hypothetical protein